MVIVPPGSPALFPPSAVRKNMPQPCQRFSQIGHVLSGNGSRACTLNSTIRSFLGDSNRRALAMATRLPLAP